MVVLQAAPWVNLDLEPKTLAGDTGLGVADISFLASPGRQSDADHRFLTMTSQANTDARLKRQSKLQHGSCKRSVTTLGKPFKKVEWRGNPGILKAFQVSEMYVND